MKTPILDELKKLQEKSIIPFHMPGHKRKGRDIFEQIALYDITEIRGYDNLHEPEGIIEESLEELSRVYHTRQSWYLVNGSTVGLHAAIAATCRPGDHIVIARNCHKAVYHVIELLQLHVHYLMPELDDRYHLSLGMGETAKAQLRELLRDYPVKAVVLTSPTYEGIVSDVRAFHDILENTEIPLIVDEAHGAHFLFHEAFPKSSIEEGADLVIQSSHKTLPSMTQTALLHLCSEKVSPEKIWKYLSFFETSSPSYILMASTEYGVSFMESYPHIVDNYVDNLRWFIKKCEKLKKIQLLNQGLVDCYAFDIGKIVFLLRDCSMNGKQFADLLYEKYHIELEMSEIYHGIAMTSVMDERADYERLWEAVSAIDQMLSYQKTEDMDSRVIIPEKQMESWEAGLYERKAISLEASVGKTAGDYINLYPPGIPLFVPGEKIIKETVENIRHYLYNGYGVSGLNQGKIPVILEKDKDTLN